MKKLLIIIILLIAIQMQAQQNPQYTQYMYNMSVVNPAYAGSKDNFSAGLLYRSQWTGIDGAPKTATLFGHLPINEKIGVGMSFISEKIGPVNETNAYADFSYKLELGRSSRLAFGVKAGATFHKLGLGGIEVIDDGDPYFNDKNGVTPNIGAGVFYYVENFYMALSVPNLLSSVKLDADGTKYGTDKTNYFLTGGYVFQLSQYTKLKPSFLVKTDFTSPTSFDFNLNALFFNKVEVGASYRLDDSISGLINIEIAPNVRIGYGYDYITSDIKNYAPGSHEIILLFDLNFAQKVSRSPRYF